MSLTAQLDHEPGLDWLLRIDLKKSVPRQSIAWAQSHSLKWCAIDPTSSVNPSAYMTSTNKLILDKTISKPMAIAAKRLKLSCSTNFFNLAMIIA